MTTTTRNYQIYGGTYTVINPETNQNRVFKIKTVRKGKFKGKRLVEVKEGHSFKAFAFANANDSIWVWNRFRGRPGNLYEKYANIIGSIARDRDQSEFVTERGLQYELAGACKVCNRTLTTPESIRLGIGPICEMKINDYRSKMKREFHIHGNQDLDVSVDIGIWDED